MPSVSGKDLISDVTERAGRRLIVLSSAVILVKVYDVNLEDLAIFGLNLPAELFDLVALCLICYMLYTLVINWVNDVAAFKLWYTESEIWSQFQTNMKLDASFIKGGTKLLVKLFELEHKNEWPDSLEKLPREVKKDYEDFKTNVELYMTRLSAAGNNFNNLSRLARFYIWFQAFLLPVGFSVLALGLLLFSGGFSPISASGT